MLNKGNTQAYVMRYNENVDESNKVSLKNNEEKDKVLAALNAIPYNGRGILNLVPNI